MGAKSLFAVLLSLALTGGLWAQELRIAVSTEPPGLDPTTNAAGIIDFLLHHNLYENLIQVGPEGELHGQIARSWEISSDGLTYIFHLRPGILFHDGTPCDARAVVGSFRRLMELSSGHPHPEYFRPIASVEAQGRETVVFHLREPYAPFLSLLALGDTVVVPPEAQDLATHPVGTGPFRFESWRPGDRLILERNPDYYLPGVPELERVVFRFIPDPAAQLLALEAGEVDMIAEATPEIAVAAAKEPRFEAVSGPQGLVQILAINNARHPFDDLRVRQAMAYAIDRDAIIRLVSLGYGTPIGGPLSPVSPYYVDLTGLYPHDPSKARALLSQAGYPHGFSATLTLPANYVFHVRTGEIIASQLAEVGIRLSLQQVDWGTWLERVYSQADYDLTVIAHIGRLDPALMLTSYGPERPDYYFRRGWDDPEVDELLLQGERTLDNRKREGIYHRVQQLIAEQVVNYFIQDPHRIFVFRTGLRGVSVYPIYALDLSHVSWGT